MKTMIVTLGCPGSGKTTKALNFALTTRKGQLGSIVRANRDELRNTVLMNYFTGIGWHEDLITTLQYEIITDAFMNADEDRCVIIDDTNVNPRVLGRWFEEATEYEADVIVLDCRGVPLETCLERNANRERRVPDNVIRQFHAGLEGKNAKIDQFRSHPRLREWIEMAD